MAHISKTAVDQIMIYLNAAASRYNDPYDIALLVVAIALAVLFALLSSVRSLPGSKSRARLPPGPPAWPVIGNLHLLGDMPHRSLAKLAQQYGPLMSMRLGSSPFVVASTPATARAILQTHDSTYASRPVTAGTTHMLFNNTDLAFAQYGPYWKMMRRVCLNHVFHPRRLDAFTHIRLDEARLLVCDMMSRTADGSPVVVRPRVQQAANNIISRITLSKKYSELNSAGSSHDIIAVMDEIMMLLGLPNIGDFIPWLSWCDLQGYERRMKVANSKIREFMGKIIQERRAQHRAASSDRSDDLLDVLLTSPEIQITDDNVAAVVMDMYLGGTGTISITVEWALAELLANPTCLKKVQEELDQVVGRERFVQDGDVEDLPYLRAVVRETFRLHPVAPLLLPREGMHTCSLGGYDLPAGTRAYVNLWAIGRDTETWSKPLCFQPERFLNSDIEENGQHYQLLPFGAGRRRCIAWELGLMNIRLFLGRLLQSFEWTPTTQKIDMTELFGLNLMMKESLSVKLSPRLASTFYT